MLKKFKINNFLENARSPGVDIINEKVKEHNGEILKKPNSNESIAVFDFAEDYNKLSEEFDYKFDNNSQFLVENILDINGDNIYISEVRLKNMEIPSSYIKGKKIYYLNSGIKIVAAYISGNFKFKVDAFRFKNGFEEITLIEGEKIDNMRFCDDYKIYLESYRIRDIILETKVKEIVSNMMKIIINS